jgi:hypothetical protein
MTQKEQIIKLQRLLSQLEEDKLVKEAMDKNSHTNHSHTITELFKDAIGEYIEPMEVKLSQRDVRVYERYDHRDNLVFSLDYKHTNDFALRHKLEYRTNNERSRKHSKAVFKVYTALEEKDSFYETILNCFVQYNKDSDIYGEVCMKISDTKVQIAGLFRKELREQIIDNLVIGDVYRVHVGLIEIVDVSDKNVTYRRYQDDNKEERVDGKKNLAQKILEAASARSFKIAKMFIDASSFKRNN